MDNIVNTWSPGVVTQGASVTTASSARCFPGGTNTYQFTVKQCENGWTIHHMGREYICPELKDVADRMITILVEERMNRK